VFGAGGGTSSYREIEETDLVLLWGSNARETHPIFFHHLLRGVRRGARLIVVDPRRTDSAEWADLWLGLDVGSDIALANAIGREIIAAGLHHTEFIGRATDAFEDYRRTVEPYTLEYAERETGVPAELIREVAHAYAKAGRAMICWTLGITEHHNAVDNVLALINLALVTGHVGRYGSGLNPLRGQNNVQGGGDMGALPDRLPGFQHVENDALRAKFDRAWGVTIPPKRGWHLSGMFDAMERGELTAVYVIGENPVQSEADQHRARRLIEGLEFLVVQDLFLNETAEFADVFLPAATFAEKDGTFTNSERRVQRVRKAIDPPGLARADWEITCELARRVAEKLGRPTSGFDYAHPSEIWTEQASLVPFLAGISYERLEQGGIQWPCPTPDHPGTRYLYAESFPLGKAKFIPVEQGPLAAELPDRGYPLLLNTGRVLYHWHGGTMTRRVEGLLALWPDLQVAINPEDAAALGLDSGDEVRVVSRRGELTGVALVTGAMRKGEVFVPFVRIRDSAANFLTNAAFDPDSKIPEYKVCAVRVEKLPVGAGVTVAG
jgi:predicted molibdopterin-dependent oxidoreductase YjgC